MYMMDVKCIPQRRAAGWTTVYSRGGSTAATGLAIIIDPLAHAGLSPSVMLIIWWDRRQECQLASLR